MQLYADGFASLSLREKILAWHLYLAALAGRDIYYDQRHALDLDMRAVLEAIVTHPNGVDAEASFTKSGATRSCSGSTAVLTTTSPHESSFFA